MALKPEVIGDVDEGEALPGAKDDLGLNTEERAAWDEMQAGAKDAPIELEPEPEASPDAPPAPAEAAPAPVAEAAPEGEDDADDAPEGAPALDPKTGKPQQKTVNWQKHQRIIAKKDEKLTATERQLQEERESRIKLNERLAILNEALTAPPPTAPAKVEAPANPMLEPDIKVEEDALAAIDQAQRRISYLQKEGAEKYEVTQATLEDRQLKDDFQRDADMFSRTETGQHFSAAYQYLKDSRLTELAISLFDKDPTDPAQVFTPAEITKLVNDFNAEEKWVVSNARNGGKSPAAAIMKLAKGRGFKPQSEAPAQAAAPAAAVPAVAPAKNGNGAHAAPDAIAKIKAETEGAAASKSLSDGGGAPPAAELTPERLLKMSDAEFARYVDTLPKDKLDAIMGRVAEQQQHA